MKNLASGKVFQECHLQSILIFFNINHLKCFWVPVCLRILQRMKNATEFLRDNFAKNRVSSTIVHFFRHLCWLDSANVILMRQLVAWPKQSWKGVKVQIVLVLCCFGTHHSEHQAHQWQMPQKIFCSWLLLQLQIPVDWGCSYSWKEKQENKLPLKNLRNHHNHLFCSSQKQTATTFLKVAVQRYEPP